MTLCPLCRAFPRFKDQAARLDEERDKLFATGCWLVAALECTHPCSAHGSTLRLARSLLDDLSRLADDEKETRWIRV